MRLLGFEPRFHRLRVGCISRCAKDAYLSAALISQKKSLLYKLCCCWRLFIGAGHGTRTHNLMLTRHLHYHCANPAKWRERRELNPYMKINSLLFYHWTTFPNTRFRSAFQPIQVVVIAQPRRSLTNTASWNGAVFIDHTHLKHERSAIRRWQCKTIHVF